MYRYRKKQYKLRKKLNGKPIEEHDELANDLSVNNNVFKG